MNNNALVGTFGIRYLDTTLQGILRSDLILIGARSGAGKSTIANQLTSANADKGTKVSLFSLENYAEEYEEQEVYRRCREIFYEQYIDFRQYKAGIKKFPVDVENRAKLAVAQGMENINLVTRKPDGFNIKDMEEAFILHARDGSQLFVIDHIDYFDMHNPGASDIQNITEIMRQIRKLQDIYRVPVVLISHLKKSTKETIIPTLEDFIGTSNKVKEATHCIVVAPDDSGNVETQSSVKRTWVAIRKDRDLGYHNIIANVGFDLRMKRYEVRYQLHKVNYWGTKTEFVKDVL
jgi:replicative DNA helicase